MKKFLIPTSVIAASPVITPSKESKVTKEPEDACKMIKPSDLPIYDQVTKCKPAEPEPPRSELEEAVSVVRKELWVYVDDLHRYKEKIVEYVETGKAHTEFIIEFLKEEKNYLPRAGAIGLGGLTGLVLGLRGGIFRRLLYGSAGAGAMASICYPREAAQYSKEAVQTAKKYAVIGYNFAYGVKPDAKGSESDTHVDKKDTVPAQAQKLPSPMVNTSPTSLPCPVENVDTSNEQLIDTSPPFKLTGPIISSLHDSQPSSPSHLTSKSSIQFLPPISLPPTKLIHQPLKPGSTPVTCFSLALNEESRHK